MVFVPIMVLEPLMKTDPVTVLVPIRVFEPLIKNEPVNAVGPTIEGASKRLRLDEPNTIISLDNVPFKAFIILNTCSDLIICKADIPEVLIVAI